MTFIHLQGSIPIAWSFDEEVDSIRQFLPEDQRSIDKLDKIFVGPAREVVYDEDTARPSIAIADELKQRRALLNSLGHEELAQHLSEKVEAHMEGCQTAFSSGCRSFTYHIYALSSQP